MEVVPVAIKKLARSLLARLDLEVVPRKAWQADYLRQLGTPTTVIDVGAGYGTHGLYQAFPDARFYLYEPVVEYRPHLEKIAQQYDCVTTYAAVGKQVGEAQIGVDHTNPVHTSFNERTALTRYEEHQIEMRTVPVTTLNALWETEGKEMARPILIKIDTEGYELDVIKGASKLLAQTDTVIAEVSIAKRFEGSYRFEEFIAGMTAHQFSLIDFMHISHMGRKPGIRYVDAVFKRDG